MNRRWFVSLSLVALGWMAGCGGGVNSISGGAGTQPNALDGQYAFVLSGFDGNGHPLGMAGSVSADGFGHINAGEVDVNDNGTVSSSSSLTGTYAFDANGNGTLGTITLTNTVGSVTHPLAFAFSLQANGDFGQIMSLDSNNFISGGTMQKQSSSGVTLAGMAGSYVGSFNGRNQTNPTSALGRFTLASSGVTSNTEFDRSEAGSATGSAGPTSTATLSLAGSGPDTNGRGTFTLSLNDTFGPTNQTFAYYAISTSRFVAVETDANGTMTADFSGQPSIPTTPATTTGGVFGMSGLDVSLSDEISAVGQLQISSTTPATATINWDADDAGPTSNGKTFTGILQSNQTVTYDATTGRGTISVSNGTAEGLANTVVFYLTAPGAGFVLDATPGASNRAMAGPLMAQATGPYSTATDLATGLAIVRTRGSSVNDAVSLVGLFGLTTDQTTYELLVDERDPSNLTAPDTDFAIPGITVGAPDPNVGRGTMSVPNGAGGSSTFVYYIIGPNQFYFLDTTLADGASTVFFASPD